MILYICLFVISYLSGAVPFSFLLVKLIRGIDLREVGSGNVGATNAGRVLGKWGFVVAFCCDMLKAFIPLYVFRQIPGIDGNIILFCALFIILGHTYTVFLRFKGGKGVATGVGVFMALSPYSLFWALLTFFLVITVFRIVSLGSIISAVILMISVWLNSDWFGLQIFTAVVVLFVIYKHKSNIVRIMQGKEHKIGERVV
jgi:glycerol-3-phosphate acyltransferase PlsY